MDRIGISIAPDVMRAVVVRGTGIVWSAEAPVRDPHALPTAIAALVASVPRTRWRRRDVTGALGPCAAQLKRISGLPANANDRALSDAVRLSASRFFLTNGSPLLTSSIVRREGELWCAAAGEDVVTALADACRATRIPFRGCVPAAAATAGVTTVLGPDEARFAEAYAAAVGGARSPFLIDPDAATRTKRSRTRLGALLAACAGFVLSGTLLGPGVRAVVRERDARARLHSLSAQSAAPLAAMREFSAAAEVVRRVDTFASSRRSTVTLLGSLSQVLPESTAIISFHVDSVGGTLVALTPVGNTILPDISRATGVVSAEITGAVTRETVAGVPVQRVVTTFRFVRPRVTRGARSPGTVPGGAP